VPLVNLPRLLAGWRRRSSILRTLALVLAVVGCGRESGDLPGYSAAPGQAGPLAAYAGRLEFDGSCFYVLVPGQPDTERVGLLWPSFYKSVLVPPGIEDVSGRVVARAGDLVKLTGGFIPDRSLGRCSGKAAWLVTKVEVIDTFPPP
jgi:hypothetical protein